MIRVVTTGVIATMAVAGVAVNGCQQNERLRDIQRQGCERGKLDREDNAAAWAAHRHYMREVLKATSVQGDVKRAAHKALTTYDRIVPSLKSRAGKNLNCDNQPGGDK